jgi:hypothetical protein
VGAAHQAERHPEQPQVQGRGQQDGERNARGGGERAGAAETVALVSFGRPPPSKPPFFLLLTPFFPHASPLSPAPPPHSSSTPSGPSPSSRPWSPTPPSR